MPGLVGIVSRAADAPAGLARMVDTIAHAPSGHHATHSEPAMGLHLGWAGFGHQTQPTLVWNAARNIALLMCGEDFSADSGAGLDSSQRLIERYVREGSDFVGSLNGSFCSVLLDLRQSVALLFNDRFGTSRLYTHRAGEAFYFASEAKALLRLFPALRRFDRHGLAQTVSMGCTLGSRTLFEGIETLPPGTLCSIASDGSIKQRSYFDVRSWETQTPLAAEMFNEQLADVFSRIVPRYLQGAQRCAMSLTGGLDGRMVLAWGRPGAGELPCYTFAGSYRECHDVRIARDLARSLGQTHTTIPIDGTMLGNFAELAQTCVYISDGTMDVSGAVEVHANRAARAIAPIRLTGNYGSEVMRANVAFRPRAIDGSALLPDLAALAGEAAAEYQQERQGSAVSFIAFKQVPWHHHARRAVEQSQLVVRTPFLDNELVALMYRAPPPLLHSKQPSLQLIHTGNPALAAMATDRGDAYGAVAPWRRWQQSVREFSAKAEYAYDYGMPQPLAKLDRLLRPLRLERLFLGRHKFYHFRIWYRRALASYVRDTLLTQRALQRSCYQPQALRGFVEDHVNGRANRTLELHRALTVELTQQQLFDRWAGANA
jgi:asparagine synthase (glutamine-hydrolysing)